MRGQCLKNLHCRASFISNPPWDGITVLQAGSTVYTMHKILSDTCS